MFVNFLPFFIRETIFVTSSLLSCTANSIEKSVYSRKQILPLSDSGGKVFFTELHPLQVCPLPLIQYFGYLF